MRGFSNRLNPGGSTIAVGRYILVFQWGQGWRRSHSALAWLGSCGGRTRPPALGFAPWWTPSSPSWACCSRLTCNFRPGTLKPNTTQVSVAAQDRFICNKNKNKALALCGRCEAAGEERRQSKRNNESCQSHFIVHSLFMNTLSGWKDSCAATHVCLTAAAGLIQSAGSYTANMDFVLLFTKSTATTLSFLKQNNQFWSI